MLVLGEAGTAINDFAHVLYEELLGEFQAAIAIYKGSLKNFFKAIAFQLGISTENEEGKQLTVEQLKEEISVIATAKA
ncbi:MAG TPA: hypothetical protein DCF68_00095, partial [Cyanothece sp. UBA12306]|nr:hypothetical protein [Cyanothece sp. UBA12306]